MNLHIPGALLCALALFLGSGCSVEEPTPQRPDVLLVVCDTLRADHLGCYGYPRPTSPVIDQLAAEGALFEDTTSQWPWTLPSMVSMFQGRYITAYRDKMEPGVPTLPELFQAAGYRTVGVVGNCLVDESQGFDLGFDQFDCVSCFGEDGKQKNASREMQLMNTLVLEHMLKALALDENGERPPVFLFVHAFDPHDPYTSHPEYMKELPLTAQANAPVEFWHEQLAKLKPEIDLADHKDELDLLVAARGRYDQEIRYFDRGLGELRDQLEQIGFATDAVGALVSDHGEGLWEHLRNNREEALRTFPARRLFYQIHGGNGYQPVMATPFVLWGRGVVTGKRFAKGVENVDLVPTLLELADIAPPEGLDGRSLVPLMNGSATEWREYVYCFGSHAISLRHVESSYKLIIPSGRSIDSGRGFELYKLNDDPNERVNLVSQQPERLASMLEQYAQWMQANPTALSTAASQHVEQNAADAERLKAKLKSLGYTGLETGE
jgi:arylsulfatase